MNTKHIALTVLFACVGITRTAATATAQVDSLLSVYDYLIANAEVYYKQREARIDSLRTYLPAPYALIEVGDAFAPYQCDSALHYYALATEVDDEKAVLTARIRLIYMMASIGYYSEGFEELQYIRHADIRQHGLLTEYYAAMNHLYGEEAAYSKLVKNNQAFFHMADLYLDSLFCALSQLPEPTVEWYKLRLMSARNGKHFDEALALCDSALSLVQTDSHPYAILAYERGIIYREMGDTARFQEFLVRSAIADVRSGITDNGSSWMLADMMYEQGQLVRAHRYIEYSLANAGFFNARLRYVQINPLGIMINRTYQHQQTILSRRLSYALIALVVLLVIFAILFIYTIYQNRKLHSLNRQLKKMNAQLKTLNRQLTTLNDSLQESNLVKEQYICRYLEVYRDYISRITKMARKAGEKDPDAFMKREMAEFYRQFDHTFLSLYRNFVTDFNALLVPEERIYPKPGEGLTTELRIFALIRLGIDSSAKIAELLCYSPNTIYNYRARVKNAAIQDRDTFEERVKQIKNE